jgi:hypothetical protein
MIADPEARELRRRVGRLRRDRPGFRFSPALRHEITAWVTMQRERGVWWSDLSRAIGIPAETLKRWAEQQRLTTTRLVGVPTCRADAGLL